MGRSLLFAVLLFGWALPALAQKPFTLEQVMRAPFTDGLVAARSGTRVAWVTLQEGRRNLWAAEGPGFASRRLTAYDEDDGQEISEVGFSDDAELIVYVRGGRKNDAGEVPNPTSRTAGAEQNIWVVAWSGGEPRKIDAGSSTAISARGTLAYVNSGGLWLAPARGEGKPQQITTRGKPADPRWSPDGSKLSFTSVRGDHSFIGVLDAGAASVRYLAPSVDRDAGAVWSRDGKSLAFVREPARPRDLPEGYFMGPDRPAPWAIWVASGATGEARELWRSKSGPADSLPDVEPWLTWTAGDRLVFPSEADGWQRLQSIAAGGGPATTLTPAGCEVDDGWALSSDGKEVIFTSNCGDVDRRHLARVPVAGGKVEPVTAGEGIEWSPAPLGDGRTLAFLGSDVRRSARPHVMVLGSRDRPKELAGPPPAADFPGDALVAPQPVLFKAKDGVELHAQLFRPRGARPGARHPAVIFLHGGPVRQMLLGWHYMRYYSNAYAFSQFLANRGYLVLSLNYRSGIGYGRAFRMAAGRAGRGAAEYQDVVAAGVYLRGRDDVDSRRIALWGGSYGGYLTALGLGRNSDLFAAGVDLHGVHDWTISDWAGDNLTPEQLRLARDSSPVSTVATWRSPVLFISGDDDRNVLFAHTVDLVARLREAGVPVEQLVFPDEVHDFLVHRRWLEAFRAASDFLDRRLDAGAVQK